MEKYPASSSGWKYHSYSFYGVLYMYTYELLCMLEIWNVENIHKSSM